MIVRRLVGLLAAVSLPVPAIAQASHADVHTLAASLRSNPVQVLGPSRSSFSRLSTGQQASLRAQIAQQDPGRIWIAFVAPRSQADLGDLGSPLFAALPAGTLILVADDPRDANTTHFWVGASFEDGDVAQARLNTALNQNKGQDPLAIQLRHAIASFASADAGAGHPPLASSTPPPSPGSAPSSASNPADTIAHAASNVGLIIGLVFAGIVILIVAVIGMPILLRYRRTSRWRKEAASDAREQANADFAALADRISSLDIDSSMPGANARAKDEYAQAISAYEDAERHLRRANDDYHFQRAVEAIKRGQQHVQAAERLFDASAAAAAPATPPAAASSPPAAASSPPAASAPPAAGTREQ